MKNITVRMRLKREQSSCRNVCELSSMKKVINIVLCIMVFCSVTLSQKLYQRKSVTGISSVLFKTQPLPSLANIVNLKLQRAKRGNL